MKLFLFLFYFLPLAYGADPEACPENFAALTPESDRLQVATEFARWNFNPLEKLPTLKAEDLLPAEVLAKLRAAYGEPILSLAPGSHTLNIRLKFQIKPGIETNVFQCALMEDPSGALVVENLSIHIPLELKPGRLKSAQMGKGIGLAATKQTTLRTLMTIARAMHKPEIRSVGQSSYGVSMLYRRGFGMKPINKVAQEYFDKIDDMYRFAKDELPPGERVHNMEEFQRIVSKFGRLAPARLEKEAVWQQYRKTNVLPPGMELIKDSNGEIRALRFHKDDRTQIFFVDPMSHELFEWNNRRYRTERLILTLPVAP